MNSAVKADTTNLQNKDGLLLSSFLLSILDAKILKCH